jgi:glycosyltransferase involved in cell wall biosynthesis
LRAHYIAEALKKRGHQVNFVKPLPTLPFWFDMAISTFYYFFHSLLNRSHVALAVKPYPMVIPALWWQRQRGAKVVIDVDDLDFAYSHGKFRQTHERLQKPWPKWADIVTFHNDNLREHLLDFFEVPAKNIVQVPQGVDRDLFNPKRVEPEHLPYAAKILYVERKKRPILTFTAHLNVACNLEPVLYSFQAILKTLPNAQLLIAGGGPDEGNFKRIARELGISSSVHFTGMLTTRQVAACLRISDVILVYYNDFLANKHRASMKLREALACNGRVVATRVGEIVKWKSYLTLSKPDPIHFADTVIRALKTKKNVKGQSLLVKKWDWSYCVENLEKELLKP